MDPIDALLLGEDPAPDAAPASKALTIVSERPPRARISEAKLRANRANAKRSTGPRTAHGKARSRLNALKHGLLSRELVNPALEGSRWRAEFDALLRRLARDLRPAGVLERMMVEEIAACYFRLVRAARFENRAAWCAERDRKQGYYVREELLAFAPARRIKQRCDEEEAAFERSGLEGIALPDPDDLQLLSRYQAALKRQLFRAIDHLIRLQQRRKRSARRARGRGRPTARRPLARRRARA